MSLTLQLSSSKPEFQFAFPHSAPVPLLSEKTFFVDDSLDKVAVKDELDFLYKYIDLEFSQVKVKVNKCPHHTHGFLRGYRVTL